MNFKKNILQFMKYGGSGGSGFLSYITTLILLKEYFGFHHLLAFFIACIIGILFNFFLSKIFVFKSTGNTHQEIRTFFLFALIGCIFQFTLVYACVEIGKVPYIFANIFAAGTVILFTFTCNKLYTFNR